ncbi:hypothetical protein FAES_1615 [Fibrella aestuarina BUZ 2]|uniref:ZU5 domain-containing protein n=1 Tax=Fibrella aestuarina BUZ 2 TaxID=1166018 RepID=I0K672_9BACT|nr:hypothetical protein [Fibrella aestuarina]CCG99625.1 hypothetical protein FAES_1615 [Fibrella aestuarina BUZ 2]
MTKLYALLFGLLLTALSVGCKKEADVVAPDVPNVPEQPQTRPGKVCPVGTLLGEATTATIGPAGGNLTSPDERLTINVPAGAVERSQAFSAQPITNTGPQGLGTGFRLAPHGITFKKPVTIRVRYDPETLDGTVAEALALAYQSDKGIWRLAAKSKVDTVTHTVSVETTHFSDWALLERALLTPNVGFVKPGDNLRLEVSLLDAAVTIPPVQDTDVPEPFEPLSSVIDYNSWKLVGAGLLNPLKWEALYYAPSTPPARNPVAVTVKLKGPTVGDDGNMYKELWLVSNIYIGDEGITYRINGGPWVNVKVSQGGQLLSDPKEPAKGTMFMMTGGGIDNGNPVGVTITQHNPPFDKSHDLDFVLTGGVSQAWRTDDTGPVFQLSAQGGALVYVHYYRVGRNAYPSPGHLTLSQFGQVGKLVTGKFDLAKAGIMRPGEDFSGTAHIEGFFRVTRTK